MSVTFNTTTVDTVVSSADTQNNNPGTYRRCVLEMNDVASAAGSGAGASVATDVVFDPALPSSVSVYRVHVTPDQDAVPFVSSKTNSGFTFTLNPRLAANTLSAGTNDIYVSWDV